MCDLYERIFSQRVMIIYDFFVWILLKITLLYASAAIPAHQSTVSLAKVTVTSWITNLVVRSLRQHGSHLEILEKI